MFDTILGIAGLAVGIAALVPIYVVRGVRSWIASTIVIVFLVLTSSAILYQRRAEGREVDRLENEIKRIFSGNNPLTFEEIYDRLNYAPYDLVEKAIDDLIDGDKIWAGRIDVKAASGTVYVVRVYNNINFPVQSRSFAGAATDSGVNENTSRVCPAALPPYNSPTVGGGHTQQEMCEPALEAYRKQYPGCDVAWKASENSNKDFLGHVTYQYFCTYAAKSKVQ